MPEPVSSSSPLATGAVRPEAAEPVTVVRETTTAVVGQSGWLSSNLRNMIALGLTLAVLYLVYQQNRDAIVAMLGAWSVLAGSIWGERSALKRPGSDV